MFSGIPYATIDAHRKARYIIKLAENLVLKESFFVNDDAVAAVEENGVASAVSDDDDIMDVRAIQITGGKLKISWIGGEHYEIRDMNKANLEKGLDLRNRKWSFRITKSDFGDIKKLSSINGTKLLNINVNEIPFLYK